MKKQVYLDGAANTFLDKRVLKAMKPFLSEKYEGNSFAIHQYGIDSLKAVEKARDDISKCLGVETKNVFFTSGATESNNWVIKSLALNELAKTRGPKKMNIVCSAIEHSSVLNAVKQLEGFGFIIHYVQPNKDGKIFVSEVKKHMNKETLLVCIMAVNNETGVRNRINDIAELVHRYRAFLLSDCTQALSYGGVALQIGANYPKVDYITFSGHKIYGPSGVGCLIKRTSAPLFPLISGGNQEQGLRGGTHNVAGIVGMAEAVKLMIFEHVNDRTYYKNLFRILMEHIHQENERKKYKIDVTVMPNQCNIVNLFVSRTSKHIEQLASRLSLEGIACSASSACEEGTEKVTPSHVLKAMNISEEQIANSVRISFTSRTTRKDIIKFIKALRKIYI